MASENRTAETGLMDWFAHVLACDDVLEYVLSDAELEGFRQALVDQCARHPLSTLANSPEEATQAHLLLGIFHAHKVSQAIRIRFPQFDISRGGGFRRPGEGQTIPPKQREAVGPTNRFIRAMSVLAPQVKLRRPSNQRIDESHFNVSQDVADRDQ